MKTAGNFLALLTLALASHAAVAASVTVPAAHVDIEFDDSSAYYASAVSWYSGTLFDSYTVPAWTTDGDALVLHPAMYLDLGASGYADGGYLGFDLGSFNFAVHSGYQITGYQISFSGAAGSVGAGSFSIEGSAGSWYMSGDQYTFSSGILGSMPGGFSGRINLDAPYVEGPDGTAEVFGTAYGSIEHIRIEAVTAPVPEPETWGLLGGGMAALALLRRRRR